MRISLKWLKIRAKTSPEGYYEDAISRGKIIGDELELSEEDYRRLVAKYRGAGDVVAVLAMPIAKVIDLALGTDLQNCGGCEQRQEALNELIPL